MIWNLSEFKKHFGKKFWKAFTNVLPFYESMSEANKSEFIEKIYNDIIKREYYPLIPKDTIYLNKWNWVIRKTYLFQLKDYLIYYFCIKKIEDKIAINRVFWTYWWWTLAWWKIRQQEENENLDNIKDFIFSKYKKSIFSILSWKTVFSPDLFDSNLSIPSIPLNPFWWREAYWDYNHNLLSYLLWWSYSEVVEFDISNFYDNIRLDLLEMKIRSIIWSEFLEEVSLLFHFLNYWNRNDNFYNKQSVWLPQDILWECSRILANFYLQEYDEYVKKICDSNGLMYFRYADDQVILWNDKDSLEKVLFLCSKKLSEIWLNINQKKVSYYNIHGFCEYKWFEIFNILSDKYELSNLDSINSFINRIYTIYDKGINKKYVKWGFSFISKSLWCKFRLLSNYKRRKYKKFVLNEEFIFKFRSFNFISIYNNLLISKRERKEFLFYLIEISKYCIYNSFHIEVKVFFIKIWYNEGISEIDSIVNELKENFYSL